MSVLRLQSLEPTVANNAVAILSTTSSGSNCCKNQNR
ncbi:class III lanthipeptide [Streptomyces sp. NPDC021224]